MLVAIVLDEKRMQQLRQTLRSWVSEDQGGPKAAAASSPPTEPAAPAAAAPAAAPTPAQDPGLMSYVDVPRDFGGASDPRSDPGLMSFVDVGRSEFMTGAK